MYKPIPSLTPFNMADMDFDPLTGKPKIGVPTGGSSSIYKTLPPPTGGSSTIYKTPPVEDESELMDEGIIIDSGPLPGDPDYQPPGTIDGTPARPINDNKLPAPIIASRMPQIEPSSAPATPDAYTPDSNVAESSLDLSSPSWGKFMSNPGSSDALLAFGAAMLGAPNFNAGLGAAGQAFGNALKPYEKMSDAEKERLLFQAKLKAKIARESSSGSSGSGSSKWRNIGIIQNADGTQSSVRFNDATNEQIEVPMNGIRAQDSATGSEARKAGSLSAVQRDEDFKLINEASGRIATFDRALDLIDEGGVGSDWYTQLQRKAALGTGLDLGPIKVSSASELDTYMAQIELDASKAIKGQGQVTEFERKIIQASKGKITSDPKALKKVLGVLRDIEVRRQATAPAYAAWDADPANRNKTYADFKREFLLPYEEVQKSKPPQNTGSRKPLSEIFN